MVKNRLFTLLVALTVCLCSTAIAANAESMPPIDLARACSLKVEMQYDGAPIRGVQVVVYQIAEIETSVAGAFSYALTGEFAGSGADVSNIETMRENLALAAELLAYAGDNGIAGASRTTGADGVALFSNLSPGLYLVSIGSVAGYYSIEPYLAAVPALEAGAWSYDVTAQPKTMLTPIPPSDPPEPSEPPVQTTPPASSETPAPTPSETPPPSEEIGQSEPPEASEAPPEWESEPPAPTHDATETPFPSEEISRPSPPPGPEGSTLIPNGDGSYIVLGDDGTPLGEWKWNSETGEWEYTEYPVPGGEALPQTGVTNWPVPVMSACGLLFFSAGWIMFRAPRKKGEA